MGLIKKDLTRIKLPDREAHNSRLFIDLCENIHIHHREFRIVFTLDEYFEFVDAIQRSTEDVRSYLAQNPDYREDEYPTTIMIAGGKNRKRKLLQNSPEPNQSTYFANDFAIELQDESVVDEIHVHWRDYRLVMPREHFKIIADAFAEAKEELLSFEEEYDYVRRPHRDRTMEEYEKEKEKYKSFETKIMGEENVPVSKIRTRYDFNDKEFKPDKKSIDILVKAFKNEERLPPIILSTEKDGSHHVIDGNHRLYAAKVANKETVSCIITDLTFEESKLFRKAEDLLKKFDRQTNYRYNTSGFNKQYFAYRASRYYYDHYHRLFNPTFMDRVKFKINRYVTPVTKKIRRKFKHLLIRLHLIENPYEQES